MSLTGSRIGPYEIVSPLGAGGMGEVYRARDTKLGRDVAIKILPAAFTADPDRRARFEREARVLASLNHPHIGAIYGFEDAGGVHALVLELVEGETLDARLRSRGSGLGIRESLVIGRQISYALDAAHERGIVHRDLKPANIVITPEGVVKVLDFGLAKAGQAGGAGGAGWEEGLTHSPTAIGPTIDGVLLGTAPYMSPEQARGKAVDKRTDIWAFGCVLYEMLTGRRAFGGETTSDTIAAVLEREPDWSIVPPATPAHVVRLLKRSLDKDPKTRLRDIGDARADLEEARTATDAGAVRQTPARRSIIVAWVAFAVMTAAAGALAIVAGRPAAPSSEIRFETTVPADIPSNFAQIALSPDGQQLAVAPAFDGRAPLWLRPLDSIAGRSLPGTEGAIFPFWSPDGRSVAFFADRKLKRITLESEAVEIVADAVIARGGTWKSDGTILYAPNLTSPIFRVPASGGTPVELTHLATGQNDHRAPVLLPGEQHFLYYARGVPQVRGVYVARVDGTESRRLLDADAAAVYAASGHLLFPRNGELFAQPFDVKRLALGGTAVRIASPIAVNPGVSLASLSASSSGAVAYGRSGIGGGQFVWFDRAGKRMEPLGGSDVTGVSNPALSPDGRMVAYSKVTAGNWDIWLLDTRGASRRLTSTPALDFSPVWSADGRRIFFQSIRGKAADIYALSVDDGGPEELLLSDARGKTPADVSPDGQFLLYNASEPGASADLWLLPLTGERTPRPFVQTRFDDRDGQFSPDGKWVAYQSSDSGRSEIYLRSFPGTGDRIQVSVAGGSQPRWGRRGLELFYVAADQRLTSVTVTSDGSGRSARLGQPVALFRTPFDPSNGQLRQQYVVSGDNQRFLMGSPVDAPAPPSIVVMLNWKGR